MLHEKTWCDAVAPRGARTVKISVHSATERPPMDFELRRSATPAVSSSMSVNPTRTCFRHVPQCTIAMATSQLKTSPNSLVPASWPPRSQLNSGVSVFPIFAIRSSGSTGWPGGWFNRDRGKHAYRPRARLIVDLAPSNRGRPTRPSGCSGPHSAGCRRRQCDHLRRRQRSGQPTMFGPRRSCNLFRRSKYLSS